MGEPLFEDVCTALRDADKDIPTYACRYGISGKDVPPASIHAVYQNMISAAPKRHFTLGITDDVTHLSLPDIPIDVHTKNTVNCKFWGFGSDGTVGANKNSIKIIGDNTDMYVQAYFEYDAKKSGGVTKSHLRFGHSPIRSAYYIKQADFLACHKQAYMSSYDIVSEVRDNGIFLLNCNWSDDELDRALSNNVKRQIAQKHVRFYTIDATKIAIEIGLGGSRTNTVLQAAFFKLSNILPIDDAVRYMKEAIQKTYGAKGEKIVSMNQAAVDRGISDIHEVSVPAAWADLPADVPQTQDDLPDFIKKIIVPCNARKATMYRSVNFFPTRMALSLSDRHNMKNAALPSAFPNGMPQNAYSAIVVLLSALMPASAHI